MMETGAITPLGPPVDHRRRAIALRSSDGLVREARKHIGPVRSRIKVEMFNGSGGGQTCQVSSTT